MEKILVEVWIPAAEHSFDVWIPRESKLYVVRQLLATAVKELAMGKFWPTEGIAICDKYGKILDINKTVVELELSNGSQIMLI